MREGREKGEGGEGGREGEGGRDGREEGRGGREVGKEGGAERSSGSLPSFPALPLRSGPSLPLRSGPLPRCLAPSQSSGSLPPALPHCPFVTKCLFWENNLSYKLYSY